jgi:hypothetical protein
MGPRISVYRKGDEVYLTLAGNVDSSSSRQILRTMRQMIMTSLKCTVPNAPVAFTLKTRGKVNLRKPD